MHTIIKYVEKKYIFNKIWPAFSAGDTILVLYEIREGTKTRIQYFKGIVIQCKRTAESFTLKKISGGIGINRIFFLNQPNIQRIELQKQGKIRRARIYYFSILKGKQARIKNIGSIK